MKIRINEKVIKFGTAGIRGKYYELTPLESYASIILVRDAFDKEKVVIARDGRNNGKALINAVESALLYLGKEPINASLSPTPVVQYYCYKHNIPGIVITASHNPPEWNGIKVIKSNGIVLNKEEGNEIMRKNKEVEFSIELKKIKNESKREEINKEYINALLSFIKISKKEVEEINKQGGVVVDYGNGVGGIVFSYFLDSLGIKKEEINKEIDGNFPGRKSEPKRENLKGLEEMMKSKKYALGIAFDGDSDRVVFFTKDGEFIDGNKGFAVIAEYWLKKHKGNVVTTVITSKAVEEIAKKYGRKVYYTKVGTSYISKELVEKDGVIGGEESSGVIVKAFHLGKDGFLTAAIMLKILGEKKLEHLLSLIPKYYTKKINLEIEREKKQKFMEVIKQELEKESEEVITIDGIRVNGKDYWYIIRPSGTEDLIRLVVESKEKEKTEKLANELKKKAQEIIESI